MRSKASIQEEIKKLSKQIEELKIEAKNSIEEGDLVLIQANDERYVVVLRVERVDGPIITGDTVISRSFDKPQKQGYSSFSFGSNRITRIDI
jgi:hypothetical protein